VVDVLHCRGANKVILNWQRPLWEGDQEVVKRSGKDESTWVAIHKCMEAMLGISLYSYPYLNEQEHYVFLIISYVFLFDKIREQEGGTGSTWKGGGGWHKQCIHI
jgi:hypothetical protein